MIAETFSNLMSGFGTALSPGVLVYAVFGCITGTLVGMMPGLGPLAGISLLLPLTFGLNPTTALVLLAGIYYGSQYGGSTTSILMRLPGEASSVMTCIDGYAMTRKGRGGAALAIAALGSFVAGSISVIGLMLLAPPLADFALRFGPPETFALLTLGLMVLAYMSSGSVAKSLAMAVFGLLAGTVGIDVMTGFTRFQFGVLELSDGIGLVPIAVGLFGISEILLTASSSMQKVKPPHLSEMLPTKQELREAAAPIGRGTVVGFLVGIIPGSAHIISSFVSYAMEKKLSKRPQDFGQGAVPGVAGPESANNAAASGAFVPMLALGVPSGPIPAVMLAALMVHGVAPGPLLIDQQPGLFWGFIASMYVGNVVLLILNLPLIGAFLWLLRIPYSYLYPAILVFCVLGVYAVNQSIVEVWLMIGASIVGYGLRKLGFEVAPVILGLILSPMVEMSLRQSLGLSGGSYAIFIERPLSLAMLGIAVVLVLLGLLPALARRLDWRRRMALDEPIPEE